MSSRRAPAALPSHPHACIVSIETPFARFLQIDVVRFRHKLFSGEWSGERVFDVVRRGPAVGIVLYDPERDSVVLIEQFRVAALCGGRSPWQIEAVARREVREEANLEPIGPLLSIQTILPASGSFDEAVSLYCGRVDARAAGGIHGVPEEQENIRVVVKSIAEVEAMLDAGAIDSAHTLICLYWLLRHRERLRKEWPGG